MVKTSVKVNSHVMSVFAFFFDIYFPFLKVQTLNVNTMTCCHRPPFVTFNPKANADVTYE